MVPPAFQKGVATEREAWVWGVLGSVHDVSRTFVNHNTHVILVPQRVPVLRRAHGALNERAVPPGHRTRLRCRVAESKRQKHEVREDADLCVAERPAGSGMVLVRVLKYRRGFVTMWGCLTDEYELRARHPSVPTAYLPLRSSNPTSSPFARRDLVSRRSLSPTNARDRLAWFPLYVQTRSYQRTEANLNNPLAAVPPRGVPRAQPKMAHLWNHDNKKAETETKLANDQNRCYETLLFCRRWLIDPRHRVGARFDPARRVRLYRHSLVFPST